MRLPRAVIRVLPQYDDTHILWQGGIERGKPIAGTRINDLPGRALILQKLFEVAHIGFVKFAADARQPVGVKLDVGHGAFDQSPPHLSSTLSGQVETDSPAWTQVENDVMADQALIRLEQVVRARLAEADPSASYVASLAAKGRRKIAQKLGEEAVETVIAALTEDDQAVVGEAADLIFHLTVLLAERGLGWAAVAAELESRHGTSGHDEKEARSKS